MLFRSIPPDADEKAVNSFKSAAVRENSGTQRVEKEINFRNGKVGQPLAAAPLYGCRIPLAGEGCARKTQEGETGEVPPMEISATERKGVCGKPKRGVPHH